MKTTAESSLSKSQIDGPLRAAGYSVAQIGQVIAACNIASPPHRFTRAEVDKFVADNQKILLNTLEVWERFGYVRRKMKAGDAYPSKDMIYAALRATTPPLYPPK